MTNRLNSNLYKDDIERLALAVPDNLQGATVAISGASGMIGAALIDALLYSRGKGSGISVLALGRNEAKARERLPYFDADGFVFEEIDVSVPGSCPKSSADIVVHLASTTHPLAYSTQPVGTITSNIIGLVNLLEYAHSCDSTHFCFASSVEIYGENRGDVELFDEGYLGYIDCNTLRAGYPESKRLGESLCQAYASERGVNVYIPRLPRTFGPTMLLSDTKAISQFIKNGVKDEDIVLKSAGNQLYSYLYVADSVSGLLHVVGYGQSGAAYNVADSKCNATLKEIAQIISGINDRDVVFELPSDLEREGYSTATKALLDSSRLQSIGWRAEYDIDSGLRRTIEILKSSLQ